MAEDSKNRIILHVDMDAFFTSCEQRENPELKGKPVIVGANPKGGRGWGVVSTASYEARKYGVYSGQPISIAWRKCVRQARQGKPMCVFLPVNFPLYLKEASKIMIILKKYSDKFESWGLDEAFLDVSRRVATFSQAKNLAKKIKGEILKKTKLTCSVGIGPNKLLAKIASGFKKPDGLTIVTPGRVLGFLKPLSIREIIGIGPKAESKLNMYGIKTIGQLQQMPKKFLVELFGKWGKDLYFSARGIDESEVVERRERKSLGHEHTFEKDTSDRKLIFKTLDWLSNKVHKDIKTEGLKFKTIVIKVRYAGFETHTHQISFKKATDQFLVIQNWTHDLIKPFLKTKKKIRLLGVKVAGLEKLRA